MKLGEKIAILRKARGFSQEQLGLSLATKDNGVSRQTVSDWENGKTEPKLDNIRALAELLNVSYDALLDEELDLSNPEYLNEVLSNNIVQSKKIISDTNYFIFKRRYGLLFIIIFLIVVGIGVGIMIPSFNQAKIYFARSAAQNGENTIFGQNMKNMALTWQSLGFLGAAITAIGAPISIMLWIRDVRRNESCGVINKEELIFYPKAGRNYNTIKITLTEIEEIKKDFFFGVYIIAKEKIHISRIKNRKGLLKAFSSLKG